MTTQQSRDPDRDNGWVFHVFHDGVLLSLFQTYSMYKLQLVTCNLHTTSDLLATTAIFTGYLQNFDTVLISDAMH